MTACADDNLQSCWLFRDMSQKSKDIDEKIGMENQISNMFNWLEPKENYTTLGPVLFLYSINFT